MDDNRLVELTKQLIEYPSYHFQSSIRVVNFLDSYLLDETDRDAEIDLINNLDGSGQNIPCLYAKNKEEMPEKQGKKKCQTLLNRQNFLRVREPDRGGPTEEPTEVGHHEDKKSPTGHPRQLPMYSPQSEDGALPRPLILFVHERYPFFLFAFVDLEYSTTL